VLCFEGNSVRDLRAPFKAQILTGADDDLYLAGTQGIVRFDGKQWSNFAPEMNATRMIATPAEVWVITQSHPR
jgi:hypothetical protein